MTKEVVFQLSEVGFPLTPLRQQAQPSWSLRRFGLPRWYGSSAGCRALPSSFWREPSFPWRLSCPKPTVLEHSLGRIGRFQDWLWPTAETFGGDAFCWGSYTAGLHCRHWPRTFQSKTWSWSWFWSLWRYQGQAKFSVLGFGLSICAWVFNIYKCVWPVHSRSVVSRMNFSKFQHDTHCVTAL